MGLCVISVELSLVVVQGRGEGAVLFCCTEAAPPNLAFPLRRRGRQAAVETGAQRSNGTFDLRY